ncbi:MAG: hypothetical protein V3U76_00700, partial [Granulosicoccus sp.]
MFVLPIVVFHKLIETAVFQFRTVVLLIGVLMVTVSCDMDNTVSVDSNGASELMVSPPGPIMASRAVLRENLRLTVTVGDREPEIVTQNNSGLWQLDTTIPANSTLDISIQWDELISGEILTLAIATWPVIIPAVSTQETVVIRNDAFLYPDEDGDGPSNLEEREAGTRFNDASDPPAPVVMVPFGVIFQLPAALQGAGEEKIARLDAAALVDNVVLPLTREGNTWRGETDVAQNTNALIAITV